MKTILTIGALVCWGSAFAVIVSCIFAGVGYRKRNRKRESEQIRRMAMKYQDDTENSWYRP